MTDCERDIFVAIEELKVEIEMGKYDEFEERYAQIYEELRRTYDANEINMHWKDYNRIKRGLAYHKTKN
jgi:hypothetical protein